MTFLSRPFRAARLLSLVREIDLGAIKNEAERRFSLELTGDADLTADLADLFSATPGRSGVHPYLTVNPTVTPQAGAAADLRLHVQRGYAPPLAVHSRVPTLSVCVLEAAETPRQVGAELPHPGEAGRVVIAELNAETVKNVLVPQVLRALSPTLHLAVGRQLPVFRPAVIRGLVEEASRANALYAAGTGVAEIVPVLNIPLNVADTVVLSKNQLVMAYKVALAAGKSGQPQELIGEIIGVLGGGLLFRQVARGLVGLIPVWGIVPKVAVAYAGTQVVGTATSLWATEGRTVSAVEVRELYAGALTRGRQVAERLFPGRRKQGEAKVLEDNGQEDNSQKTEIAGELGPPSPTQPEEPEEQP